MDRRLPASAIALLAMPAAARAQEGEQKKQPPPDFTSGYAAPSPTTPAPRGGAFATLDVAILGAVLVLTAYLSLTRRSRREVRVVALFSLLYFGFTRLGCVCSVGSIQNVAMALGGRGVALPFHVAGTFLLPLVAATFFGRAFCGAACPLGAVQDLVLIRPKRVPPALEHALGLLPYAYLGLAVLLAWTGSAFVICKYDPFVALFRMSGPSGIVTTGAVLLGLATVIGRPYCRFLCPYGVLLRWAAPLARWHVRITPTSCVQCHLCADACPFGAIRPPTAALPAEERAIARARFVRLLAMLPAMVVLGAALGRLGSPALARMNHTVALAERAWLEENHRVTGMSEAVQAYRNLGRPNALLYRDAVALRARIDAGTELFGAWLGLVIGLKLLTLSIRRTRTDYEADPAACLHCARCYLSCPVEHERLAVLAGHPPEATA